MADPFWTTPYLETCCRSALHRLWISARTRPFGTKDEACLKRLQTMGLAEREADGYALTASGRVRYLAEVRQRPDALARDRPG